MNNLWTSYLLGISKYKRPNCKECAVYDDDMNFIFYMHHYYCVVYKQSFKNEFENNQSSNNGNKYNKNYFNCNSFSLDNNMTCISFPKNDYKINGIDNCFALTSLNESCYKCDVFYFCEDYCLTSSEDKNKKQIIVFVMIIKVKNYFY